MSETMTHQEREEHVRQVATSGMGPRPPVTRAGASAPASAPEPNREPMSDDDLLSLKYNAESYQLANGRGVFVHPLSIQEAAWLNSRAWRDVSALGLPDDKMVAIHYSLYAKAWQVICCVRMGPEMGARKAFTENHAEILLRNPGWIPDIESICAISDSLTGGVSEAGRLKEALLPFFESTLNCCETLCSQLETVSPEELRITLEGFAGSVLRAKSLLS